jgi:hypothetical protein
MSRYLEDGKHSENKKKFSHFLENNKLIPMVPISLAHLVRDNAQYVQGLRFEPRTPHLFIFNSSLK